MCPPGASCSTAPQKTVVFNTATFLGYVGGAGAIGDDEKAKFESAIEEAMAAGANGVTATVAVTGVTDTSRRLGERTESAASEAYDGMIELASNTFGLTTEAVKKIVSIDIDLKALAELADEDVDPTRRSLSVTEVKVDYTITVSSDDNAAIGDFDAIKVCSSLHRPRYEHHEQHNAQRTTRNAQRTTRNAQRLLHSKHPHAPSLLRPGRRALHLHRRHR